MILLASNIGWEPMAVAAKLIAYTSAMSSSIGSEFRHQSSTSSGIEPVKERSSGTSSLGGTEFMNLGTLMETSYCYQRTHGRSR